MTWAGERKPDFCRIAKLGGVDQPKPTDSLKRIEQSGQAAMMHMDDGDLFLPQPAQECGHLLDETKRMAIHQQKQVPATWRYPADILLLAPVAAVHKVLLDSKGRNALKDAPGRDCDSTAPVIVRVDDTDFHRSLLVSGFSSKIRSRLSGASAISKRFAKHSEAARRIS